MRGIHIELIETGVTKTVPKPNTLKGIQVNCGIAANWVRDGSTFIANANVPGRPTSIWAVPVTGGEPRKLRDDAYAWAVSRDGSWVAFSVKPSGGVFGEMWRMRPDGQEPTKVYKGDEHHRFFGADWSPDSKRLSYIQILKASGETEDSIASRDVNGGPAVVAVAGHMAEGGPSN